MVSGTVFGWTIGLLAFFFLILAYCWAAIAASRKEGGFWGGVPYFDMRAYAKGGKMNRLSIIRSGGKTALEAGGGEVLLRREMGWWDEEEINVPTEDHFYDEQAGVGFLGRLGVIRFFKIQVENKDAEITSLKNLVGMYAYKLSKAVHNPDDEVKQIIKHMEEASRAVSFAQPMKPQNKSSGGKGR